MPLRRGFVPCPIQQTQGPPVCPVITAVVWITNAHLSTTNRCDCPMLPSRLISQRPGPSVIIGSKKGQEAKYISSLCENVWHFNRGWICSKQASAPTLPRPGISTTLSRLRPEASPNTVRSACVSSSFRRFIKILLSVAQLVHCDMYS